MVLTEDAIRQIVSSVKPRLFGGMDKTPSPPREKKDAPPAVERVKRGRPRKGETKREETKREEDMFKTPEKRPPRARDARPPSPSTESEGDIGGEEIRFKGKGKKRGGAKPAEVKFFKAAKEAYEPVAPANIGEFDRVLDTPTMDAYRSGNTILVGVRGTDFKSGTDLKADASIAINNLKNSNRYVKDKKDFQSLVNRFPPSNFEYYLAGHSLSGAVNQQLKREFPFIKEGVSYNPAFQPSDLAQQDPSFKRYYTNTDFLYNLGGKLFRNVNMVAPDKPKGIRGFLTPKRVSGHFLSNFEKLYQGNTVGGGPVQSAARGAMNLMDRAATRLDIVALRNYGDQIISEAAGREVNEVNAVYVRELVEEFNQLVVGRLTIANEDGQDGDFEDIIAINNEIAEIGNPYFVRFGFTIDLLDEIPPEQQEEDQPEGVGAVVAAPPAAPPAAPLRFFYVRQPDGSLGMVMEGDPIYVRNPDGSLMVATPDRPPPDPPAPPTGSGLIFGRPAKVSPERSETRSRREAMEDRIFESTSRLESGRRVLRESREREQREAEEDRREEQRERERRAADRTARTLARRGYPESYYGRRGMTGRGKKAEADRMKDITAKVLAAVKK